MPDAIRAHNPHSTTAIGRMTTVYRHSEITSDAVPFPSPSSAPDAVTETAGNKKSHTDNTQRMCTDDHRPDIFGEKRHQRRRERQTQHSADHHNARAQRRYLKNTADAFRSPAP